MFSELSELSAPLELLLNAGVYLLKAVVIVVLGLIASAVIKRLIRRLAVSWREHGYERKADTLTTVLLSLSQYVVGFITVCAVLGVFNIPVASIIAVAGVGSVAIGFGAQSLVKDFITGFFILLEDQFGVGDLVTLAGKTGTVEAIGMRTTRIRGFDGELHILPNSQILFVTNLSGSYRRGIVDLHAADGALSVLSDELRSSKDTIPALTSEPSVIVMNEPEAGIIRITAECRVGESTSVEAELKRIIKERFDREGIEYSIKGE